ncbi:MAG: acetyl-CoA carboxylase biotin carboxyl carrier protein [Schaedlerella sp.]|nr:acetyl-CoA carboxylase biotin carboxyl carrier protein [Schaedlerella sp.]
MELDNIVKLIKAVSESGVTGFKYEHDGVKLNIQKETVQTVAVQTEVPGAQPVVTTVAVQPEKTEEKGNFIKSPLVGRFYAAPAEDAKAFVSVGEQVKKGQVVAIVEAMKLMNDIESEFDGTVAEVLVENGETVEYGQPLFRIV